MEIVQPGRYYQLGIKTFWLLVIERASSAFLLFVLSFALTRAKEIEVFYEYSKIFGAVAISFIIAGIAALVISVIISELEYVTSRVMMDDSSFHIVRGILSKKEISIPYRRIQSVEIKQSLLYRILGVGHVVVETTTDMDQTANDAGDNSEDEVIRAMDYPLARLVGKTLTDRAEVERMEIK